MPVYPDDFSPGVCIGSSIYDALTGNIDLEDLTHMTAEPETLALVLYIDCRFESNSCHFCRLTMRQAHQYLASGYAPNTGDVSRSARVVSTNRKQLGVIPGWDLKRRCSELWWSPV